MIFVQSKNIIFIFPHTFKFKSMSYTFYKRTIDLAVSVLGLLLILPLMITIALILYTIYKGNPFFSQLRPGLYGQPFRIYKFKTMSEQHYPDQPEEERLTPFGNLLRVYSLDELPQLWNVIIGNMSLIGPRPLLCEYLPHYNAHHRRRHNVKPGITGWAQVHGRNRITWDDRLSMDVWYVDNVDFIVDLKIIFLTLVKVCTGDGVYAKGNFFVEKYNSMAK